MKRRWMALFLSGILMVSVLCSCGEEKSPTPETMSGFGSDGTRSSSNGERTSGEPVPVSGGNLVVGMAQPLDQDLDPYQITKSGTREVWFNVYEGLVKPNASGEYVPAVASDYHVSEDQKTYTFSLRENIKFHNGDLVTLEDVLYSYESCRTHTEEKALQTVLSFIECIEQEGENSVAIRLKEPVPDFLAYVSMVYISPKEDLGRQTAPAGTGPFQFIVFPGATDITLEKFPEYWGQVASLDRVTIKTFESGQELRSALEDGSVDLAKSLTWEEADQVEGGSFRTMEGTVHQVQALYLNHREKPFDNQMVRQALCYAVDVEDLLKRTSDGHGERLGSAIYPGFTKYYDESLTGVYPHNKEKAKSLLREAGYKDGFSITITVLSGSKDQEIAEALADQLDQVGIRVSIKSVGPKTWKSRVCENHVFESVVMSLDAEPPSAGTLLDRWESGSEENIIHYKNQEYDGIIEQIRKNTDEMERTNLYRQASKLLTEDAASVYIQDPADFVLMKSELEGYEIYPLDVIDLSTIHYMA